MNSFSDRALTKNEKTEMLLRELYNSFGFKKFKMNRFEEYDLYREYRSFLTGSDIITFNDLNGKLMALKPDVTLSIVKNVKDEAEPLKLYYSENVYRGEKGSYGYKEIVQTGVEHIGELDLYSVCEIITLAVKSLELISDDYILDISHLGILSEILDECNFKEADYDLVVNYIGKKNTHDLKKIFDKYNIGDELFNVVAEIAKLYGRIDETLEALEKILCGRAGGALNELKSIALFLKEAGISEKINLDFSLINDLSYYNGIIFQGFVSGLPKSVLSGGRYDKLLEKLGKNKQAIGFAVYLNLLEGFESIADKYDFDNLILYDEKSDFKKVFELQGELLKSGETVRVQKYNKGNLKYKNVIDMSCGGGSGE